jgi:moderate conductance mechanosensitive channel
MISVLLAATTSTTLQNPAADAITSLTNLDQACGVDKSWACRWIYDWTGSDTWAGVADWAIAKPLAILLVVLVAILASRLSRWIIKRSMLRFTDAGHQARVARLRRRTPDALLRTDEWNLRTEARVHTLTAVFRSLATGFIWFVAAVWILDIVGVNFGPLIATAGIAGIALGFGTQTMVKDFIAGFFIVAEDQFGVGDVVDLGGEAKGTVEQVTLRATRVRDVEGTLWHVPNGQLTRVANKSQEWARALIDVVVPYQADLDAVTDLMQSVADDLTADDRWQHEVLEQADIWGVQDFAADGVHVRMVIKTRPAAQFGLLRELRRRLKSAFDTAGIAFAYAGGPTEVVLRDEAPPGTAPGGRRPPVEPDHPIDPDTSAADPSD